MKKTFRITIILAFACIFVLSGCKLLEAKTSKSNSDIIDVDVEQKNDITSGTSNMTFVDVEYNDAQDFATEIEIEIVPDETVENDIEMQETLETEMPAIETVPETPVIDKNTYTDVWKQHNNLVTCTISIEGLDNEPIVTTPNDQNSYLRKNILGEYSISGTLFTAYDSIMGKTNVTTVFGHSMENGTMFGTLKNFKSLDYLKKNPTFTMTSEAEEYKLKIISVADVSASYVNMGWYFAQSNLTEKEFAKFEKETRTRSFFVIPDKFDYESKYVLLCTCDYSFYGERLIIVARIMDEQETIDTSGYNKNPVVLRADEFYETYASYGYVKPTQEQVDANFESNYR